MQHRDGTVERLLARLGFSAHGVVTRERLLREGATRQQLRSRLATGALLREYPGVYRVGHRAPSVEAHYLAAVYACGEAALLSGLAAAHLLVLVKGAAPAPEVTAPGKRRVPGVITHRTRRLDPSERMVWRAIPVTSVARTLVDIAARIGEDDLARACHEAAVRYRTTPADVDVALARYANAPGSGTLRAVLRGDVKVALSKLETHFHHLLREAALPLPDTNVRVDARRVDCRWPAHRLTVELNSYRYHQSRYAWENDQARQREAYARGDQFRSYTWGDVFERPRAMLEELRVVLASHLAA